MWCNIGWLQVQLLTYLKKANTGELTMKETEVKKEEKKIYNFVVNSNKIGYRTSIRAHRM